MIDERYSMEVGDTSVLIHGILKIDEAIGYLEHFQKEGFNEVFWGDQNSCLHLIKSKILNERTEK